MPGSAANRARSAAPGRGERARPRVGLALAGGGPLGGIYEVGALLALADSLDGLDLDDLDVYVGVSSGGFVAAALANGISPAQMYRLFIDDGADAALTPELFLRPALSRIRCCAQALAAAACRARRDSSTCATRSGAASMESFATLSHAMPTGMFDNRAIDDFLRASVRGAGPHQRLPQARAQALPGRDESRHRRVGDVRCAGLRSRADLEGDRGVGRAARPVSAGRRSRRALRRRRAQQDAARVRRARRRRRACCLCVNPLVPFDASPPPRTARLHRREAQRGRPAARARADVPRDHPFADEGRHGKVPAPISRRRRTAVRAGSRGRRHVLRQHLQLFAAHGGCARPPTRRHARTSSRARSSSRRNSHDMASRCGANGLPTPGAASRMRFPTRGRSTRSPAPACALPRRTSRTRSIRSKGG